MKRILISGVIGCSVLAFCSFTNGTSASAQHRDGYFVQDDQGIQADQSAFQDTTMKKKKHKKKDSTSVSWYNESSAVMAFQDTTKKRKTHKKKDSTSLAVYNVAPSAFALQDTTKKKKKDTTTVNLVAMNTRK